MTCSTCAARWPRSPAARAASARETARTLAAAGASVAILDVLSQPAAALVEEIRAQGGKAAFWSLDVTHEADVARVFGEIVARFGRLDVLVNNAGIEGHNVPTHGSRSRNGSACRT